MTKKSQQAEVEVTETTEVEVPEVTTEEAMARLAKGVKGADKQRMQLQVKDEVINPIVFARALGVRPQMIYNYIRSGKIEMVRDNNTQKMVIPIDVAIDFARRRYTKEQVKAVKAAQELAGK